jgi:hypothetical protein
LLEGPWAADGVVEVAKMTGCGGAGSMAGAGMGRAPDIRACALHLVSLVWLLYSIGPLLQTLLAR